MSDTERGTGRTTRAMAALADGSVYIVAHHPMREHCRHLLADAGRRHDALRIVTGEEVCRGKLRGIPLSTDVGIDHAFWELAGERQRLFVSEFVKWRRSRAVQASRERMKQA